MEALGSRLLLLFFVEYSASSIEIGNRINSVSCNHDCRYLLFGAADAAAVDIE